MRILAAVQALFAAVILLLALSYIVFISPTGVLLLLPAGAFAATAAAASTRGRAGVVLALGVDLALAVFAASRLRVPTTFGEAVPAIVVALVAVAFAAVLLDWRRLLASRWFDVAEPLEGRRGG